jgi:hypothetical protein
MRRKKIPKYNALRCKQAASRILLTASHFINKATGLQINQSQIEKKKGRLQEQATLDGHSPQAHYVD